MLKTCVECGHKNLDDANFCEICGSKIGNNLVKAEEDDVSVKPEMIEKPQVAPEKSWWSRQSSGRKALTLIVAFLAIILVAGLVWMTTVGTSTQIQNQDASKNTLEVEKNNKMQAIQNSEEFKQAINNYIEDNYSGSNPSIKYLAVKDLKTENEILVVMDVEYTSDSGEVKTHHYEGTWTKVDGIWQPQSDFKFATS